MSLLEHAIRDALDAHRGQMDKIGLPYILHPLQVMFAVVEAYKLHPLSEYTLEELMIAALLHDVVEDTHVTLENLVTTYGHRIAGLVDGVTRREATLRGGKFLSHRETYHEFILRAAKDPGSRFLKRVDIKINLGRLHSLPPEEQSISKRYERALVTLDDKGDVKS